MILPLVVLIPIGQVLLEWIAFARLVPISTVNPSERGFDWVFWQESDGTIEARYVLPTGPASRAGIQPGDVFFSLDQQVYFNVEELKDAIEGIPPGSVRSFVILRGDEGEALERAVRFTRYPTFLYPLSAALWQFSIWSFTVAAFLHVLGLLIVGPVALRRRRAGRARFSLLLILASSLWIFGNWLRLLFVEGIAPPGGPGSWYDNIFQVLSFISLIGWIGFPAILLRKVLGDTHLIGAGRLGAIHVIIYLPTIILGAAASIATLRGSLGPFSLDGLVPPIFILCLLLRGLCRSPHSHPLCNQTRGDRRRNRRLEPNRQCGDARRVSFDGFVGAGSPSAFRIGSRHYGRLAHRVRTIAFPRASYARFSGHLAPG